MCVCVLSCNVLHGLQRKNETSWTFEMNINRCMCSFIFFCNILNISLKSLSFQIKLLFNLICFACCWQHSQKFLFCTHFFSSFLLLSQINETFRKTNYACLECFLLINFGPSDSSISAMLIKLFPSSYLLWHSNLVQTWTGSCNLQNMSAECIKELSHLSRVTKNRRESYLNLIDFFSLARQVFS